MATKKRDLRAEAIHDYELAARRLGGDIPAGAERPGAEDPLSDWKAATAVLTMALREREESARQLRAIEEQRARQARAALVTPEHEQAITHILQDHDAAVSVIRTFRESAAQTSDAQLCDQLGWSVGSAAKASTTVAVLSNIVTIARNRDSITTPEGRLQFVDLMVEVEAKLKWLQSRTSTASAFWPNSTGPGHNLAKLCQAAAMVEVREMLDAVLREDRRLTAEQAARTGAGTEQEQPRAGEPPTDARE